MNRRPVFVLPAIALAACTSTGDWQRSDLAASKAETRRTIDVGYCRQVASGSVAMPSIPQAKSAPSYNVDGTYRDSSGRWGTYHGTARPTANFGTGFAEGLSTGLAIRAALDAKAEREEIFAGCMTRLGWRKKSGV